MRDSGREADNSRRRRNLYVSEALLKNYWTFWVEHLGCVVWLEWDAFWFDENWWSFRKFSEKKEEGWLKRRRGKDVDKGILSEKFGKNWLERLLQTSSSTFINTNFYFLGKL
jgi:hypothetical protein